jgi:glycine hydroxymethyltransferase
MKILELVKKEEKRQKEQISLIASENYVSEAVKRAVGSDLMNKYSEGYPGRRYYQGNKVIDEIESGVQELAKKLFGVPYVNVQPYSGSPANAAIYMALSCTTIFGLDLRSGGHLTHGHPKITFSGKYFKTKQYGINERGEIDFERLEEMIDGQGVIVAGTTAYPRILDWKRFSEIAEKHSCWLMADISHVSGLVVGGVYPSPVEWADVVMTTTHKTLRGPRGAMIMVTKKGLKKDEKLGEKIDRAVFPGLQGGPHNHTIAGIGVALEEASQPEFKKYAEQIVKNAQVLGEELKKQGFKLVTGGTDSHLLLVDLRDKGIDGKTAAEKLEREGIVTNANSIPNDPASALRPSGLRLGTAAVTTRGMKEKEMRELGDKIAKILS